MGLELGNTLGTINGNEVYTCQRQPPPFRPHANVEGEEFYAKYWREMDFLHPEEVPVVVASFVAEGVDFDGVVLCTCVHEVKALESMTQFDLAEAMQVNTLGPLMLVWYLLQHGCMKDGGKVILCGDSRKLDENSMPYTLAKAALPHVFNEFFRMVRKYATVRLLRVNCNEFDNDLLVDHLIRLLTVDAG